MRRIVLIFLLLAAAILGVGVAHGERLKRGDLLLSFDVDFSPHALPRDRPAPVTVDLNGSVQTSSGEHPPQLQSILLDVNRYGQLDTRGLPVCPRGQLEATSSEVALEHCRDALVGHGRFTIVLKFKITHQRGVFGTVLFARIPAIASNLGYVTDISLTFGRMYRYKGKQRSFISARCAAPDGFPGAIFPLARGTFTFSNDQRLSLTLTRDCRVL
jgi:hypothetical protein